MWASCKFLNHDDHNMMTRMTAMMMMMMMMMLMMMRMKDERWLVTMTFTLISFWFLVKFWPAMIEWWTFHSPTIEVVKIMIPHHQRPWPKSRCYHRWKDLCVCFCVCVFFGDWLAKNFDSLDFQLTSPQFLHEFRWQFCRNYIPCQSLKVNFQLTHVHPHDSFISTKKEEWYKNSDHSFFSGPRSTAISSNFCPRHP